MKNKYNINQSKQTFTYTQLIGDGDDRTVRWDGTRTRITIHRRITGSVHRKKKNTDDWFTGSHVQRTTGPNYRSTTDRVSFYLDVPASL